MPTEIRTYEDWCKAHGVGHAHCPDGCEHPQPAVLEDGRCICMRCYCKFGEVVEVVPCTPDDCGEDR